MTAAEVARVLNVSHSTVTMAAKRKSAMKLEHAIRIARYLGVSVEQFFDAQSDQTAAQQMVSRLAWLRRQIELIQQHAESVVNISTDVLSKGIDLYGQVSTDTSFGEVAETSVHFARKSSARTIRLPVYGNVAAGQPIDVEQWTDSWADVEVQQNENPQTHFLLHVTGSSMVNAGINDGDVILVRRYSTAEDGQIVVVHDGDGATVKRLKRTDDGWSLAWDDGSGRVLDVNDHAQIQGVFVRVV